MKHLSTLGLAAVTAAVGLPAHADIVSASFAGVVSSQVNSGVAVNAPIAGSFTYNTTTAAFTQFTIGGLSVAPGWTSTAIVTPDFGTALYQAQVSPVGGVGTVNNTFTLDLEALIVPAGAVFPQFSTNNAIALLLNPVQMSTNVDKANSSFGWYTANGDGSNVESLTASLSTISAVPEPAVWALWLGGAALLAGRRLGRRAA